MLRHLPLFYQRGDVSVGSGCVCLVCWYGSRQGKAAQSGLGLGFGGRVGGVEALSLF